MGATAVACRELVWRFEPGATPEVAEEDLRTLMAEKDAGFMGDFLNHCFCWGGKMLYPQGDTQFFNHSSEPNIVPLVGAVHVALTAASNQPPPPA